MREAKKNALAIWSCFASNVRQLLVILFNWIIQRIEIQNASSDRYTDELFVHSNIKFDVAYLLLTFNL